MDSAPACQTWTASHAYAVMDILPFKLCNYVCASNVKRFRDVSDIGYCASRKMFFYGFKLHIQIFDHLLTMGYVVTASSCHDRTVSEKVMAQLPHPHTFGDKGYTSKLLQEKLMSEYGIAFWTPFHKNQRVSCSEEWKQWMCRKRKIAETSFSVLVNQFHLISIRANSVVGFEIALDGILLSYTIVVLGLAKQ
jgi:Transposase DDE domain